MEKGNCVILQNYPSLFVWEKEIKRIGRRE